MPDRKRQGTSCPLVNPRQTSSDEKNKREFGFFRSRDSVYCASALELQECSNEPSCLLSGVVLPVQQATG